MELEPIIEALVKSLQLSVVIIPLLFVIDFLNHKYGDKIKGKLEKSKKFMPVVGATLGLLPGCNIAVVAAVLFSQGMITIGTLVAAIIATSDEALYVFIPTGYNFIPLLAAKFAIAVVAGYLVDLVYKKYRMQKGKNIEVEYCCSEHPDHHGTKGMFIHALKHGVRIIVIIFLVLSVLNYLQDTYGFEFIENYFASITNIQPLIMGIIGLVPGCGTSVAIGTLLTENVITFGAAVAGLSAASGEAVIVLIAKGLERRKIVEIVLLVLTFSVLGGYIFQLFL